MFYIAFVSQLWWLGICILSKHLSMQITTIFQQFRILLLIKYASLNLFKLELILPAALSNPRHEKL